MGQVLAVLVAIVGTAAIAGVFLIPIYWRYSERKYTTYAYIGTYCSVIALAILGYGLVKGNKSFAAIGGLSLIATVTLLVLAILNRKNKEEA